MLHDAQAIDQPDRQQDVLAGQLQAWRSGGRLGYKNTKNTFSLPGLGKLVLVNRKTRVGRNPATGETIQIKAKRAVKFRVAKAAKDAILGTK